MDNIRIRINSTENGLTIKLHLNGRFLLAIKSKSKKIQSLILNNNRTTTFREYKVFRKSIDNLIIPWHLISTL
jgi:hypothetical protein